MNKNVEIIFPFAENKEATVMFFLKVFVVLRELNLDDVFKEKRKFEAGEDLVIPISEVNLATVEQSMQSLGYVYKILYR
ncbi:hypothetical protein SAMN05421788_106232 [Filimonas lacunae]|uniref:Uncharacterized protein n=1 Tax=Filimonas lacunae TaxID=477680 RepID=A0A173MFF2_9BACT|nr:hypothetical protein [Filimonas lacunae]BAV06168.1 hypothetical protein FLA_2184 [Filimonas lacunae]SIT25054.1 hypothetical protein SAMN05421788_106232 [Filimonas lacunae]